MEEVEVKRIFGDFVYKGFIKETSKIKEEVVNNIILSAEKDPNNAKDWSAHTSFFDDDPDFKMPNLEEIYNPYIKSFVSYAFRNNENASYLLDGPPWYTLYNKGQSAQAHEHIPSDFVFVHFLKSETGHSPLLVLNPNLSQWINSQSKPIGELMHHFFDHTIMEKDYEIYPEEGSFVIFPAQLIHLVPKSELDSPRITVACNFTIITKEIEQEIKENERI